VPGTLFCGWSGIGKPEFCGESFREEQEVIWQEASGGIQTHEGGCSMGWTRDGAGIAIAGYHSIRRQLRESIEEKAGEKIISRGGEEAQR